MPKFVRQNELRRLFKRFINAALKSELSFAFAMERITRLTEELKEMAKEETIVAGHNATPIEQVSNNCGQLPVCSDGVCIDFRSGLTLPSSDFMFPDLNVIRNNACYTSKRFKFSKEIDISGRVGPDSPFVEGTWMLN
ncbi:hypothetical protein ACLOJK_019459 [Asimina triloba]